MLIASPTEKFVCAPGADARTLSRECRSMDLERDQRPIAIAHRPTELRVLPTAPLRPLARCQPPVASGDALSGGQLAAMPTTGLLRWIAPVEP
jgi:hypothetical protein